MVYALYESNKAKNPFLFLAGIGKILDFITLENINMVFPQHYPQNQLGRLLT